MPYASSQGTLIHYEVEGEGPPLVLQHGLSGSLDQWRVYGFVQELGKNYQVILIDARGHGQSDKPHSPEFYQPELMAGDVVAVLDDLGIGKAHYWGQSMGGWIGYSIARQFHHRFHSLILSACGACVMPETSKFRTELGRVFRVGLEQGMQGVVSLLDTLGAPEPHPMRAIRLSNDPRALVAVMEVMARWPGAEDLLPDITIPCLLMAGELDPDCPSVRESARRIPGASFICLSGLGHSAPAEESDLVLPHVKEFLARVAKAQS